MNQMLLTPRRCLNQIMFHVAMALVFAGAGCFMLHAHHIALASLMALSGLAQMLAVPRWFRLFHAIKNGSEIPVPVTQPLPNIPTILAIVVMAVFTIAVAAATVAVVIICNNAGGSFAWWRPALFVILGWLWVFTLRTWHSVFGKSSRTPIWGITFRFC